MYYFFKKEKFIESFSGKKFKNFYFSYHFRPKKMIKIIDNSIRIKNNLKKVGIIIQGPLKLEDNFTYETIRYYKKIYKNCEIILSTWSDEENKELEKIEKLGINILKNKRPNKGDVQNLNYQVISTKAGIELAEKKGCYYLLKTRTDFRIYDTGVDKFLISLLETYPSNNFKQNKRIIGIELGMRKYDPSFSDLFQFGTLEELKKMWDIELNKDGTSVKVYENISKETFYNYLKNIDAIKRYNELTYPEGYILKNYLKKLGIDIGENLENYYKVLKDNFIIIDTTMINLYWYKYSNDEYKGVREYRKKSIAKEGLGYKDWQMIYYYDVIEPNLKIYLKSVEDLKKLTIEDIEKGEMNENNCS